VTPQLDTQTKVMTNKKRRCITVLHKKSDGNDVRVTRTHRYLVRVGVRVRVLVFERVGDFVIVFVALLVGVLDLMETVRVIVARGTGLFVPVATAAVVAVGVCVGLSVGVSVWVCVAFIVRVEVAVSLGVCV
jgi:hypothetical protein